jgi:hypothetical protein
MPRKVEDEARPPAGVAVPMKLRGKSGQGENPKGLYPCARYNGRRLCFCLGVCICVHRESVRLECRYESRCVCEGSYIRRKTTARH